MDKQKVRLVFWLAALLVLSSCGPLASTPLILPPEMIGTAVVQTSAALATQTAENMPPATRTPRPSRTPRPTETPRPTYTPSQTPTPTVTFVLVIPTFSIPGTPTSAPPPTHWSPGVYVNPASDECLILTQNPFMSAHLSPKADFDAVWTVKNYGNIIWYGDGVDIVYLNGDKMQKYYDSYDLGVTVKPGETVTVSIDMRVPANPGNYSAVWGSGWGRSLYFATWAWQYKSLK
jgi:hypothetical protein